MTFREPGVKPREAFAQPLPRAVVVEPVAYRLGQVAGSGLLLQQLRHDELAGEHVGEPHVGQQQLPFHQPVGELVQPVGDDHRAARERRFQRRRAAGDQGHLGRVERQARVAEEDGDGKLARFQRVDAFFEVIARIARSQRHEEAQLRAARQELARGLDDEVGVQLQLAHAASGKQRHRHRRGAQAQLCARLAPVGLQRHRVGERMAHEAHRDAGLLVQRLLEGVHDQHAVDGLADGMDALRAPGPDRRAHVMHRRNARGLELPLQAEIEVRRVDADEQVGTVVEEVAPQARADAEDLAQVLQHLDVAAHRELLHGIERARAFGDHPRTGDAVELDIGPALPQRAHQSRAEQIARRLAGDDRDPRPQRRMPRVAVARKSANARTSGTAPASRSSSARASASVSPDL